MADICDLAQERMEQEEALRAKHREMQASTKQPVYDEDGEQVCEDCYGQIHPERIKIGYTNCIECQTQLELGNKLYD